MPLPTSSDPSKLTLDVLFPESYEASKRAIARDFAFFGGVIVASVLAVAVLGSMF